MKNSPEVQQHTDVFAAQAVAWGISVGQRYELEALARTNLKPAAKFEEDDWVDLEFRSLVAEILTENGLGKKAQRYLMCSRCAFILRCQGDLAHEFFSPNYCDLRFCRICAPRQFNRLFAKHSGVLEFVRRKPKVNFRLRQITLTSKNSGEITHQAILVFNAQVKKTLQILMKSAKGWGAIAVLEVGFNNSNLHAHILIYCPYVEQTRLAEVWHEVSGHRVVWINQARVLGPKALLYLLKYVSKLPSDQPELIGKLEVAFHQTRRIHAYGIFYNFAGGDEDGELSHWRECPKCGARLERISGLRFAYELRREGLKFIGDFPRERGYQKWVN